MTSIRDSGRMKKWVPELMWWFHSHTLRGDHCSRMNRCPNLGVELGPAFSGDDSVCIGCYSGGEHHVVVRIVEHDRTVP